MSDRDFLMWVYARLWRRGEAESLCSMIQLRAIIAATPADRVTTDTDAGSNGIGQLRRDLGLAPFCPRCGGTRTEWDYPAQTGICSRCGGSGLLDLNDPALVTP